jgi:hypothetical protein
VRNGSINKFNKVFKNEHNVSKSSNVDLTYNNVDKILQIQGINVFNNGFLSLNFEIRSLIFFHQVFIESFARLRLSPGVNL